MLGNNGLQCLCNVLHRQRRLQSHPKGIGKYNTIAQTVRLLDMLKEGKSYAVVGNHYGIKKSDSLHEEWGNYEVLNFDSV